MEWRYRALRVVQTSTDKALALFAAPGLDIESWAGIPQKRRLGGGEETTGFQREENPKRIASLRAFYGDAENVIQNPLLCATRTLPGVVIHFESDDDSGESAPAQTGWLIIETPDLDALSLEDALGQVRAFLEARVPELATQSPSADLIDRLKGQAHEAGHTVEATTDPDLEIEGEETDESTQDGGEMDPSSVLFEESHIADFWQEVAARDEVLKLLGEPIAQDSFLGFSREALLSFLKPIVLVDGQHRLKGALEAARARLDDPGVREEIEHRISAGEPADRVERSILSREVRSLPISLLLCGHPAEQVFQFVVVNQKATPVGRALLGTIVSTTLSNEEMATVAGRLKMAGIQLEESQAITYLARHRDSPFFDCVERGLTGDSNNLLQWNVFASLVNMFRELRGGKLFHQKRNDYALIWRTKHLEESKIVADYEDHGFATAAEYWRSLDGPWRDVFMRFWSEIRDRFGNTEDPDKPNYWGRPRDSNLFNKISLTILAADFFQFLVETKVKLDSLEEITEHLTSWLEEVSTGYFDKDWNLSGVKKDSTGIKKQWASLWTEYRRGGGPLPDKRLFRKPMVGD